MTEPTLTDWHTLFTTVRERFPDAPGLPEGCDLFFITDHESQMSIPGTLGSTLSSDSTAALCIMLDWAIRFGAWWEDVANGRDFSVFSINSRWSWHCVEDQEFSFDAMSNTHHAAYFAAVQAIVAQ
jgi:hypothetical protein